MDFDSPRLLELLRSPAEDLAFEIKEWLNLSDNVHKARLAQALIALANYGGGAVLIGYTEQADGSFVPTEPRPSDLSGYTSDVVNEISRAYLNPPVHCDVRHIAHPVTGDLFPVITIAGGHSIPIMAKRGGPQGQSSLQAGRTYIRRVGPSSEEPQSPEEWRTLLDRCIRSGREELVDRIRLIVAGEPIGSAVPTADQELDLWIEESEGRWRKLIGELPANLPARFPLGYYRFAYRLRGEFDRPSLQRLRDALAAAEVRFSGWPHWPIYTRERLRPAPVDDTIECWLGHRDNAADASPDELDYWRVSIAGKAYSIRGLNEDSHPELGQPGTGLDITTPTRRLADALTHASNLAAQLGMKSGDIDFDLFWSGLAGRRLVSWGNRRRTIWNDYFTRQPQYHRRFSVEIERVLDQLPEITDVALRPMYDVFDFFRLPADLTTTEIAAWRRGN
jgi:hypothetical protein